MIKLNKKAKEFFATTEFTITNLYKNIVYFNDNSLKYIFSDFNEDALYEYLGAYLELNIRDVKTIYTKKALVVGECDEYSIVATYNKNNNSLELFLIDNKNPMENREIFCEDKIKECKEQIKNFKKVLNYIKKHDVTQEQKEKIEQITKFNNSWEKIYKILTKGE